MKSIIALSAALLAGCATTAAPPSAPIKPAAISKPIQAPKPKIKPIAARPPPAATIPTQRMDPELIPYERGHPIIDPEPEPMPPPPPPPPPPKRSKRFVACPEVSTTFAARFTKDDCQ